MKKSLHALFRQSDLNNPETFDKKEIGHLPAPVKAHVSWKYDTGEYCYYKLEISDVAYNMAER